MRACDECSRLWDKPLPPQSGCNECYDLLRDSYKELESELERIKGISKENYNRAEEINRIRTEEVQALEEKLRVATEALEKIEAETGTSTLSWKIAKQALELIIKEENESEA